MDEKLCQGSRQDQERLPLVLRDVARQQTYQDEHNKDLRGLDKGVCRSETLGNFLMISSFLWHHFCPPATALHWTHTPCPHTPTQALHATPPNAYDGLILNQGCQQQAPAGKPHRRTTRGHCSIVYAIG